MYTAWSTLASQVSRNWVFRPFLHVKHIGENIQHAGYPNWVCNPHRRDPSRTCTLYPYIQKQWPMLPCLLWNTAQLGSPAAVHGSGPISKFIYISRIISCELSLQPGSAVRAVPVFHMTPSIKGHFQWAIDAHPPSTSSRVAVAMDLSCTARMLRWWSDGHCCNYRMRVWLHKQVNGGKLKMDK